MKTLVITLNRKRNLIFSVKGITIVELLIGAFVSLLVITGIMEFYLNQHNQWLAQEQISDMQQNGRVVMEELSRQIRMAGYQVTGQPAFAVSGETLTIYTKPGANVDTIKYYVDRADTLHPNLVKKVDSGTPQVLAENITQISYTDLGSGLLQVSLTARQNRKDEKYSSNSGYRTRLITSKIKIRNS